MRTENRNPLLPVRHPTANLFVCDIFDAAPKSDMGSMEFPLFTLATKRDMKPRDYTFGDVFVRLTPSAHGLATVHDRDVLIFCISQCMAALNEGRSVSKTLRIEALDLLETTNRATGGRDYKLLQAALRRLQGTQIETNIMTGGVEQWEVFSFIDRARTVKKSRDGRMLSLDITLSDWVFNAIDEKGADILTISRDYFRLRRPLERRLYEIARKHCGRNPRWTFRVETLFEKTGSTSTLKEFRRMIREIVAANHAHDHIPDYTFELEDDLLVIRPRPEFLQSGVRGSVATDVQAIALKPTTYETASRAADGWSVYGIEDDWRAMIVQKAELPANPDGAFIEYVRWYARHHGPAR